MCSFADPCVRCEYGPGWCCATGRGRFVLFGATNATPARKANRPSHHVVAEVTIEFSDWDQPTTAGIDRANMEANVALEVVTRDPKRCGRLVNGKRQSRRR